MTDKTFIHIEVTNGVANAAFKGDEMSLVAAMVDVIADILSHQMMDTGKTNLSIVNGIGEILLHQMNAYDQTRSDNTNSSK